jgi:hypothetical protein
LEEFIGSNAGAVGTVDHPTHLTTDWQKVGDQFAHRSLRDVDYVFADGIRFNVRLEEERLCALVIVGVVPTAPRSWSRSVTFTGSRSSPGPTCCGG